MNAEVPIEIDVASVKEMLEQDEKFLLLDCREPQEHALVNLPQATLIPMQQLQARLAELESHREQRIVVYCHLGGRSLHVTHWLRKQGFASVQNMTGGIDAWAEQIDPSLPRY